MEKMKVLLVYHSTSLPGDSLLLAEGGGGVSRMLPQTDQFEDFSVHTDSALSDASLDFMTAMASIDRAGHILDFIICGETDLDSPVLCKPMPWTDHYLLGVGLRFASFLYRGSKLMYICL